MQGYKRLFLLSLLVLLVSGCSSKIDITFAPDSTWSADAYMEYDRYVLDELFKNLLFSIYLDEFLLEADLPIVFPLPGEVDETLIGDVLIEELTTYYLNQEIAAEWDYKEPSFQRLSKYTLHLEGRNLEQFEALAPGVIDVSQGQDGAIRLDVDCGDGLPLLSPFVGVDIVLHTFDARSTNAPFRNFYSQRWHNPSEIHVEFMPCSEFTCGEQSGIVIAALGVVSVGLLLGILAAVIIFFRRKRGGRRGGISEELDKLGY